MNDGSAWACYRVTSGENIIEQTDRNGDVYGLFSLDNTAPRPVPTIAPTAQAPRATDEILNRVYSAMFGELSLTKVHRDDLHKRGLSDDAIARHGLKSMVQDERRKITEFITNAFPDVDLCTVPGFYRKDKHLRLGGMSGLWVPVRNLLGQTVGVRIRLDEPDLSGNRHQFLSSNSYNGPGPQLQTHIPVWSGNTDCIRITEGELKSIVTTELSNVLTLGIPGVSNCHNHVADCLQKLGAKRVLVAFDADQVTKHNVSASLERLVKHLESTGISVSVEHWKLQHGKGIDDVYALNNQGKIKVTETSTQKETKAMSTNTKTTGATVRRPSQNTHSDTRPKIKLDIDHYKTVKQVIYELSQEPINNGTKVYQRGGELVQVVNAPITPTEAHKRNALTICAIKTPRLSEIITERVRIFELIQRESKKSKSKEDNQDLEHVIELVESFVEPPFWLVKEVLHRGEWNNIPVIVGVTSVPYLCSDGTVSTTPGYNRKTGIVYAPKNISEIPSIPDKPTLDDAKQAVELLYDVVCDFRFKDENHRAVWLAYILTLLAINSFDGPIPFTLVEASTQGEGKTLSIKLAYQIATGQEIATRSFTDDDDEMQKRLLSIASSGERGALLDNIKGVLGGSALEGAITSRMVSGRVLGKTQDIKRRFDTVMAGTSNNCTMSADMVRRTLLCRLESMEENPSQRGGFKYPDVEEHVRTNQIKLTVAALTVLRAYFVAEKPKQPIKTIGSFAGWSSVVQSAVYWVTGCDVAATMTDTTASASPERETLSLLIVGLEEFLRLERKERATSGDIARTLARDTTSERFPILREALENITERGKINSRKLGRMLAANKRRIVGDKYLDEHGRDSHTEMMYWSVMSTKPNENIELQKKDITDEDF